MNETKLLQIGQITNDPTMVERVKEIRRLQNEKRLTIAEIKEKM